VRHDTMRVVVLVFFLFAAIWTRLFVRIFVFYVPDPQEKELLALRVISLSVAAWLVIGIVKGS
jgi:hypothetical protein